MTQAEKMAEDYLLHQGWPNKSSEWEGALVEFAKQVAERTVREILLIGWHPDDEMKIASCRWWEDKNAT